VAVHAARDTGVFVHPDCGTGVPVTVNDSVEHLLQTRAWCP
jgi:hypothetical protein